VSRGAVNIGRSWSAGGREVVAALPAESGGSAYAGTCPSGGRGATTETGRSSFARGRSEVMVPRIPGGRVREWPRTDENDARRESRGV
jgi:hypothetical protein